MEDRALFGLSVVLGLMAWAAVCVTYVWPWVGRKPLAEAARPLIMLHLFRFVGASFLISGVAGPTLSSDFAAPSAYGDLFAVVLAWVALATLRRSGGVVALWVFNVWGTLDLLFAFYKGTVGGDFQPSDFGATFYIPTLYVPLLLCSHFMLLVLLLRQPAIGSRQSLNAKLV